MRATTALLLCTSLTLAGGLAQPALAQDAAAAGILPDDASGDTEAAQPEGDIVVTGSRLAVTGYTAASPTTVLDAKTIEQRAPAQVSDIIDRLPSVRLSAGPQQQQRFFNSGATPIDLRGFGAGRTLTLVDGNRFGSGTIDSALIPVNLIDRIDVVTGGASAAYGSDAVAGVVNFVLRKRMEGISATAQFGISEHGDDIERVFNLAFGTSFLGGRGHVIVGVDYSKNDGVGPIRNRDWGRRQSYLVSNGLARPAGVPAQSFYDDVTYSRQTNGGIIFSGPLAGTAFGPGGTPYAFDYGTVYTSLMVGGENPNGHPNTNAPLLTPTGRRAGLIRAELELTPAITVFAEGNYGYVTTDGNSNYYQAAPIISIDNAYLPEQTREAMQAAGVTTITVGKYFADPGGFASHSEHETLRGIGGFEGRLFGDFNWDASFQYSQTDNTANVTDVVIANFLSAVNAVKDSSGNIVCGSTLTNPNLTDPVRRSQVQPGCVPLNIFGYGSASQASLDYVGGHGGATTGSLNQLWGAAGNLRGSPFATWAGDVQLALGAEWRKEAIATFSNPLSLANAWNATNVGEYSGSLTVKEAYGEIGVPLATDAPFARTLSFNGAFRITDYSTSGVVHTWKLGGVWEPVDGLRLRGTRSRDIRAPALGNLFANSGANGCCNITNPFNGESGRLAAAFTGNPNLGPEIADTVTAGVVLAPQWEWARWFRASVDYYDIKLKDAITSVAATEIISRCYQGQQEYCAAIVFDDSTFGISYVKSQPFNLNQLRRRGLDMSVDMNFALASDTKLGVGVRASKVISIQTNDRGRIIERAGSIQGDGVPTWNGTIDVSLTKNAFKGTLSGRYFSEAKYDATLVGPEDDAYDPKLSTSLSTNRVPARAYFDLYSEYTFKSGGTAFTVFGMVQNLLDKDPWAPASASIISGGDPYDLIGRRFRIGLRVVR
ncbi:MAG TPA: TonB-dependent receptor [Croceibacterium sp.]|nr:TonB-dependent receptor [Croceibacterium sp.]